MSDWVKDYSALTTETGSVGKETVCTREKPYLNMIRIALSLLLFRFLIGFESKSFEYWQICLGWIFSVANNSYYPKKGLKKLLAFCSCEDRALYQLHTSCEVVHRCQPLKVNALFEAWHLSAVSARIHLNLRYHL